MAKSSLYHRIAGRNGDQASKVAKGKKRQLNEKEYRIETEMVGDVNLDPTMTLTLSGTQSAFDMQYQIVSVTHRFSDDDGYTMEITGQNASGSSD